jgi:hypothetical protein
MQEQEKRATNLWLTIWGIGVAFLIQVLYDGFGLWLGKSLQFVAGCVIAVIFLASLVVWANRLFPKK